MGGEKNCRSRKKDGAEAVCDHLTGAGQFRKKTQGCPGCSAVRLRCLVGHGGTCWCNVPHHHVT